MIDATLVRSVPEQLGYIVKTGKVRKLVSAWIEFLAKNSHNGRIVYPEVRRLIVGFEPIVRLRLTLKLFAVSQERIDLRHFDKICKRLPRRQRDEAYADLAKAFAAIKQYDNAVRVANTHISGTRRRRNTLAFIDRLRRPPEFQRAERGDEGVGIRPASFQWHLATATT